MVGNIPLKEQNSSKYRYGYEYKNGKEFVEAWSKFRGGVFRKGKAKNCTNIGQPDKRYITDPKKLYTEWVHDRLQSGRYNDLVAAIGE